MSLKNKKGFTLLEMMIVIAVIAILVAVVIPILTGSTDKAAAATNAANLRSVEGEVITAMLLNPAIGNAQASKQESIDQEQADREADAQAYEAAQNALTAAQSALTTAQNALTLAQDALTAAKEEQNIDSLNNKLTDAKNDLQNHVCNRLCSILGCTKPALQAALDIAQAAVDNANVIIAPLEQAVIARQKDVDDAQAYVDTKQEEVNALEAPNNDALQKLEQEEAALYTITAVNGVITLPGDITIKAPVSQKVNLDGVEIEDGIQMTVYIDVANRTATASYIVGDTTYYNKHFAAIADNTEN